MSKNPAPPFKPQYEAPPPFPLDYDWHEQARVIQAWHKVHRRAPEMLATLVAHANDERYLVTFEVNKWHNASVRDVCCLVPRDTVECYGFPPGTLLYRFLPWEPDEIVHWWDAHQKQSLVEIQIEMLQRTREALAENTKRGCGTSCACLCSPRTPDGRGRRAAPHDRQAGHPTIRRLIFFRELSRR